MMGRFIALEGADGAGKSTLARLLAATDYATAARHLGQGVPAAGDIAFVSRRQVSATSAYSANLMRQLATMLWDSGDATDLSPDFWVPLQAAWFTAHSDTVITPLLRAGYDVVVDGWIYKFWSKLLVQGYRLPQLETIFAHILKPDLVILLRADLGAVFDRREHFRPSELGMHAGYSNLGRQSFIDYQAQGYARLLELGALLPGWVEVELPAGHTIEQSRASVAAAIAQSTRQRHEMAGAPQLAAV